MQKNISRREQQSRPNKIPFVNQEGNDGYKQLFNWQQALIGRILWTGRDSVVRIVPGNDGSTCFPQVINQDIWTQDGDQTQYLSDTFYMTDVCDHFGEASMDIVSALRPGSSEWETYPESPMNYFCNSIHRAVRATLNNKKTRLKVQDKWRTWTSLGGTLPYPKATLFFQAICQVLNGSPCKASFDEDAEQAPLYGIVGITHRASIGELLKALVEPMDRRKPIGSNNSNFGALAELEGNWLYLNTSVDEKGRKYLTPSVQPSSAPANAWEPSPMPITEEEAKALWIPWDRAFNYLTVKEQIDLLCSEFGTDTVQYVFSMDDTWKGIQFNAKIGTSQPATKHVAKPAPAVSSLSSLSSLRPKGTLMVVEEETVEEPTWESPKVSSPMSDPKVQAAMAKIKQQVGMAQPSKKTGNLAQDLLSGIDDSDLDL